ncbi:1-acyl-sn-glycerol-3-phosphate acyltransferase, partial [Gammaproteobacteria bacterium]|nr:1-acyl-sn-glycerol-3-phosphate acyltransferase [Gammaproteobacteria bacterium]
MKRFDSIRPYTDSEVQSVLQELSRNKDVVKAFISASKYSYLTKAPFSNLIVSKILQSKIKDIHTIKDYQSIFENLVSNMIDTKTSGFTCNGFENIEPDKAYLYISNHRDITVDPALLNFMLHQNNYKTTNIAVGNNLMSEAWASDLMRLNKSFIIDRTGKSKREIYQGLNLASEYIEDSILDKSEPIWIAQKQGRAKDGIDETDPALLKMIHLIKRKSIRINDYFNSLCFIPVAVSYEFDPNDLFKANELYALKKNQEYIKSDREDLNSIANGISGQKGLVNLNIGPPIIFKED